MKKTKLYPNGDNYVGEFKDGQCSGQGIMTYSDGSKYVGVWNYGKPNGQGIFTDEDGTILHENDS